MQVCSSCGQQNEDVARFCLACGAPLAVERPEAREERRMVTVLFVDLVGSTSRAEALDPEDVRTLLTKYHDCVRNEIEHFGGTVEKFVGDAVMAVFGAPVAFGDDPERAVRAALAVRHALRELNETDPDLDLQTRIAVNTGEALVALGSRPGQGEAMVVGDVVNTASRLQTGAPVGAIVVGSETYVCTRTAIEYAPADPITAKGKSSPIPVWLAVDELTAAGERPLSPSPMLGRERELGVLRGIWEQVTSTRRPHLVTVFGPPGIGKSRLGVEFGHEVSALGGRTIRGRSTPYGASSPYAAFALHAKQIAGIFDSDELAVASEKLRAAVDALIGGDDVGELTTHLAMLMGIGTETDAANRDALFYSARRLVEGVAARQPTLLVFEDLQWADGSLFDLLEDLAVRLHEAPVLLLSLARPDLLTARAAWGGGLPNYTALLLEPLGELHAEQLAVRLLEHHEAARRLDQTPSIVETAEGNPLFIEELAATLAERKTGAAGALPTSIRGIVAARLDALPEAERAVLLDAAVVGRVFWEGALSHPATNGLPALLTSLERRDFIRREAVSRILGDRQFRFKHSVIRDVAYQTLPRVKRSERHREVARFLEERTAETAASADALAHHWREAGEPARALEYLVAAAEQAGRGWAKERAVWLYGQALELVPEGDEERRRAIRKRQAVAAQALYHVPDAQRLRRAPEA